MTSAPLAQIKCLAINFFAAGTPAFRHGEEPRLPFEMERFEPLPENVFAPF